MRRLESLASDSTTLKAYLQEIAQFPPVDGDQERLLAERIQGTRDDAALSQLVGAHLGGVVRYARRYRHLGVPLLDLIHDGNLALIDAARRFDPGHHGPFNVYAAWWVRQGIMHRLSESAPADWPGGIGDLHTGRQVEALQAALEHSLAPTGIEATDLSEDDVRVLDQADTRPAARGDADGPALDMDDFVEGVVAADEDAAEDDVRTALLADLETSLLELDPKERRALELRLGLRDGEPRNTAYVGRRLGVSQDRAERLAAAGVRKLRRQRAVRSSLN